MQELFNLQGILTPRGTYISHMSLEIPSAGVIQRIENHNLDIACSRPLLNVIKGDPVVCKFVEDEHEYIITGDVVSVTDQNTFRVIATHMDRFKNNRRHTRHAVSLNAVVAGIDALDYVCSAVKSISNSGISLNSKYNYEVNGLIIVSIITSTVDVIHFIGKVARKNKIFDYFEYGVEISSIVSPNTGKLESYIQYLDDLEREFLEKSSGNL